MKHGLTCKFSTTLIKSQHRGKTQVSTFNKIQEQKAQKVMNNRQYNLMLSKVARRKKLEAMKVTNKP